MYLHEHILTCNMCMKLKHFNHINHVNYYRKGQMFDKIFFPNFLNTVLTDTNKVRFKMTDTGKYRIYFAITAIHSQLFARS
jgi:hypothetical protein